MSKSSSFDNSKFSHLVDTIIRLGFIFLIVAWTFGWQIKSGGENSFAVKLSEQVIGIAPHIIPSIIDKPIPSDLDGNKTNFEELYNSFRFLSGITPW